jgi:hypothetical protein
MPWVSRILEASRIASQRRTVELRRLDLTESFVGPLVIVFMFEGVEDALLGSEARSRRPSGFRFQCPVHPLVSAILFRVAWQDSLGKNSELNPPNCKP